MTSNRVWLLCVISFILFDEGLCYCASSTSVPSAVTTSIGYISSPNYPSSYPTYQDCTWTASVSGGNKIIWALTDISVERRYDTVEILYGSTRVYNSDNSYDRRFGVSTSALTVTFDSDYSVQYGGFQLAYMAVSPSAFESCGSTVTAGSMQVLSYSYTEQSQSSCTITVSASTGNSIQFKVPFLYGTVTWVEGSSANYIYRESNTATYVSSGNSIQIRCTSYSTYLIEYEEVVNSVTGSDGFSRQVFNLTKKGGQSVPLATVAPSASDICATSGTLTAQSYDQYITSPNYPSPYGSWLSCNVILQAPSSDGALYLEIVDVDLGSYDTLYIWDGPSSSYPSVSSTLTNGFNVTSTGSSFSLRFYSDGYSNLRGVNVKYRNITRSIPSCVSSYASRHDVTSSPITLTSPGFPSSYSNNYDEYWLLVKPLQSDNIVLQLTSLKIEDQYSCNYDYISIYDGPCDSYNLLAKICGEVEESITDSTGQYVMMHFHTDSSITYKGFSMQVYIGSVASGTTGEATEDENSGTPDWIYGPLVVLVVIIIIIVASCYITFLNKQKKARVAANGDLVYQKPQKMTTHQMLSQFENNKVSSEQEKLNKKKTKRKPQSKTVTHPEPNPPGPHTNIINKGGIGGHPAPGEDPVYPPMFYTFGDQSQAPIAPTFVSMGGGTVPSNTAPMNEAPTGKVPDMFAYLTPAEARDNGTYGQRP